MPGIKYYNTEDLNQEELKQLTMFYNSLLVSFANISWDLKEECLKYLRLDLVYLFRVMDAFKKEVHLRHGVEVTKASTISKLALNIFMSKYFKDNIPLISSKSVWADIKESYFGGITEVYMPYGEDLFYYDVNSLYPYAALNPMPGLESIFHDYCGRDIDINALFGFFHCEIENNSDYFGLLPYRTGNGIIMPNGNWRGWYFSEELKFAAKHGYKIKVLSGHLFNKSYDVFTQYINDIYKLKSEAVANIQRLVAKDLLNHLLGRFAMDADGNITVIVNEEVFARLETTRLIHNSHQLGEDSFLVTLDPVVNEDVCKEFNVYYYEALNERLGVRLLDRKSNVTGVSIVITAAVNSYARIYMNSIKLDLRK